MRALCLLRESIHYRRLAFCEGLTAAGYEVVPAIDKPRRGDVLVVWNRYGAYDEQARRFESAGGRVFVVENGYLGKSWRGQEWFSLAIGHHSGAGQWNAGGGSRWDAWGVELAPWRTGGKQTLILGQRGIGEVSIRSPDRWAERTRETIGGRIRPHPGTGDAIPIEQDLDGVESVATWHSGAAFKALMIGVPVWYGFPYWIGAQAALPISQFGKVPAKRSDDDRLEMFRRLAWAMWTLDEIRSGDAFANLEDRRQ